MSSVLKLKKPLQFGKLIVEKLTFHDHVTAGDMLAFDTGGIVSQNIALIASLTDNDESLIKQLDRTDYLAAVAIVNQLFADDEDTEKK